MDMVQCSFPDISYLFRINIRPGQLFKGAAQKEIPVIFQGGSFPDLPEIRLHGRFGCPADLAEVRILFLNGLNDPLSSVAFFHGGLLQRVNLLITDFLYPFGHLLLRIFYFVLQGMPDSSHAFPKGEIVIFLLEQALDLFPRHDRIGLQPEVLLREISLLKLMKISFQDPFPVHGRLKKRTFYHLFGFGGRYAGIGQEGQLFVGILHLPSAVETVQGKVRECGLPYIFCSQLRQDF